MTSTTAEQEFGISETLLVSIGSIFEFGAILGLIYFCYNRNTPVGTVFAAFCIVIRK